MAFPKILHCLVCEDLRQEGNKKSTILGFYGVAPHVDILFRDLNQLIPRLAFLLVGDKGEGEFEISMQLIGPDGKQLISADLGKMEIRDPTKRYSGGLSLGPLRFPGAGTYTLKFLVDGREHYKTTFGVRQGEPGDFD